MKPLTPAARQRLQDAFRSLSSPLAAGADERKILHLETYHRARRTRSPSGNALSCAGVRATCTWSDCEGLLKAWKALAARRLADTTLADQEAIVADTPITLSAEQSSTGRTAPGTAQSGPGAPQPIGEATHG